LPSRFIGPNGHVQVSAPTNTAPTIVLGTIDRDAPEYAVALTKARPWRHSARQGDIYRTRMVSDPRSTNRTCR